MKSKNCWTTEIPDSGVSAELQLVCPKAGREPNLALLRCGKGGNPDLKVLEPLWV